MLFRHLMLLFNQRVEYTLSNILSFQNISCYCLTRFLQDISLVDFISKHLMLLFNSIRIIDLLPIPLFQNISCYCLTSYPLEAMRSSQIFQNISCYCLTSLHSRSFRRFRISKHLMLLFNFFSVVLVSALHQFQNISCYCLTDMTSDQTTLRINFKTSHVIV